MDECPKGSPVRLTHGLVAPGVNDLCYADGIHRLQKPKPIFIPDGEAQRHVWLTLFSIRLYVCIRLKMSRGCHAVSRKRSLRSYPR
jgi:hypothetical protein